MSLEGKKEIKRRESMEIYRRAESEKEKERE